jgi:hypothetical protein
MKQFFSIRVIALVTILLLWFAVVAMSVKPVPATSGAQAEQTYAPSAKE